MSTLWRQIGMAGVACVAAVNVASAETEGGAAMPGNSSVAAEQGELAAQQQAAVDRQVQQVRDELRQMRDVNLQLLRRIQQLENQLPKPKQQVATSPQRSAQPAASASGSRSGQQQTEKPKRAPGKSRGVEDLVLEEHTLFDQTFSLELGFELTHFDRSHLALNGFLALDAIFLGDISIDEIDSTIYTTSLAARWGITDRLQLSLRAPWIYRETTTSSGGQELASTAVTEEKTNDSGLGDVSLGVSYRLFPETLTRPDIVWNFSATAPTGREPYGINFVEHPVNTNLSIPEELPTGSGLWALTTGFSFLKTTDPAILFANFSYTHYLEESFSDLSSDPNAPAAPGDVLLGDQYQIGLGIAFALNERTSLSTSFTQRFAEATEITSRGATTQEVVGSETTSGTFDMGVTYALTDRLSVVGNLGIGLTQDASDYTFALRFPYRF